mgnify:CR=1 FL=1
MTNFYGQYIGFGAGFGVSAPSFRNMGTNAGYYAGGYPYQEHIDKNSFTSDGDSTNAGDLINHMSAGAGCSDGTYGWIAGGSLPSGIDVIQKFTFATDSDATDISNLLAACLLASGCNDADYGYAIGGLAGPIQNVIQRWVFATGSDAADVGDLTLKMRGSCGLSSATHGFGAGGENDGPTAGYTDVICRFAFADATGDAVDHGDLFTTRKACAGNSSTDYGFVSAGSGSGGTMTSIDRFAFESNTTATDWADMNYSQYVVTGTPSTTHGYQQGGGYPLVDYVEKFPYASQTNATDIGNLISSKFEGAGCQF